MNKLQTFQEFLTTSSAELSVIDFIINFVLAAVLSFILSNIYERYGNSLSNRKAFARNFLLLTVTVMLVIAIVKSSLALSLGLVGALSIVRFRAAIKEPEELNYLFISIAIGLGMGADQRAITVVAFILIVLTIIVKHKLSKKKNDDQFLNFIVSSQNPAILNLENIIEILEQNCSQVNLKRFDDKDNALEASFQIYLNNVTQIQSIKNYLKDKDKSVSITFLDNRNIM